MPTRFPLVYNGTEIAELPTADDMPIAVIAGLQTALDGKQNTSSLATDVRAVNEVVGTQSGTVISETNGRIQSRALTADLTFAGTGHTIADGQIISITFSTDASQRIVTFPSTMDSRNVRAASLTITIPANRWCTVSVMRIGSIIHVDAGAMKA